MQPLVLQVGFTTVLHQYQPNTGTIWSLQMILIYKVQQSKQTNQSVFSSKTKGVFDCLSYLKYTQTTVQINKCFCNNISG